jgi:thiol-disulfide isomerase/thioredoxin
MGEPISGTAASAPKGRRLHSGVRGLLGAALVLGLLFAWMARDDRNSFERMRGDWSREENAYWEAMRGTKTAEARRKVAAEKLPKPDAFAERCLDLARSQPGTPAELAALCWAVSNAPGSEPGKEAFAILKGGRLDHADPAELLKALNSAQTSSEVRPKPLAPLVLEAAKRNLDHPRAAQLLTWVCASQFGDNSAEQPPTFAEAADLIAGRFAASPDISNFCETLGTGSGSPPWAGSYEKHLRTILVKNRTRLVRCTASFALASVVQGVGEERQDEAEALYRQFVKDFDGSDPSIKSVEDNLISSAKTEAAGIRARGIGAPAPAMDGVDLEGRQMTLADFRGKVVVVSFWATWCSPCMKLIPHERSLLERFKDKPFAIVGVNGDREPEELRKALAKTEIPWRSFRDERPGKELISGEWKVSAWPTLYLIDHEGVIRKRWVGTPGDEALDREVGRLMDVASRAK